MRPFLHKTIRYARLLVALSAVLSAAAPPAQAVSVHAHSGAHPVSQHPSQGYLGIEFHDLTDEQALNLHLKAPQHGAEIAMVDHDGPAGKAGLRPHDVVVMLNNQVIDSAVTLRRLIHDAGAGMTVALQVVRAGRTLTLTARLANREEVERDALQRLVGDYNMPSDPPGPAQSFASPPNAQAAPSRTQQFLSAMMHTGPFTGLSMETMTPQLAGFFGVASDVGLLVNSVLPNSPAATAGIHAGDILLRADSVALHSTGDWTHHLRSSKSRPIAVSVLRDHHELTLTLTPDLKRHSEACTPGVWPDPGIFTA